MSNLDWLSSFVNTSVDFLEGGVSGHSPALISVEEYVSFGPKPFKFFNFWADHPQFLDWFKESWSAEISGFSMFQLYSKLKATKGVLKVKNKVFFGGLSHRVDKARLALATAQAQFLASHGSVGCHLKEMECLHEFVSISNAEEKFLKQKSRSFWLNLGDGNSSYFHRAVKVRNSLNLVKSLKGNDGRLIEDKLEIKEAVIQFYQKLFGESFHSFSSHNAGRISELIHRKFSPVAPWG
jgi:hypothetical protein